MWRPSRRCALHYLRGVCASPGGSVASLLNTYRDLDSNVKVAAAVPSSQRYFYERAARESRSRGSGSSAPPAAAHRTYTLDDVAPEQLSQRHTTIQLRLGAAQLLTSTTQQYIANDNAAHPLYFTHTSPRQAGLCMPLVLALKRLHVTTLTELQGALVPLLLRGKHVVAHAETGTGKSFGIALAIANRILRDNINYRLHTVILVPTEELALQYDKWLRYFCGHTGQICQVAIDRIPREQQLARLHNMLPHVLVGTPHRVAELTQLSSALLGEKLRRKVDCVVLDEADLILSTQLHHRDSALPPGMSGVTLVDRLFRTGRDEVPAQLVAASATIDGATARQLNTWTRNDKTVRLTTSFVEHTIPDTIHFYFFASTTSHPLPRCLELALRVICRQTRQPRILVFTAEDEVAAVVRLLQSDVQARVVEAHAWLHGSAGDDGGGRGEGGEGEGDDNNGDGDGDGGGGTRRLFAAALQRERRVEEADGATLRPTRGGGHGGGGGDGRRGGTARSTRVQPLRAPPPPQYVCERGNVYVKDNSALSRLNDGTLLIGVAGHALSRGLHIRGVTHVILYGQCPTSTMFAHCVGRTGRMGHEGDVLVLFDPASGRAVQQACQSFEIPFVAGKLSQLEALLSDDDDDDGGGGNDDGDDRNKRSRNEDAPPSRFGTATSLGELDAMNAQLCDAQQLSQRDDEDEDNNDDDDDDDEYA